LRQKAKLHVGLPNIPGEKVFFRHVERMIAARRLTNDGPLVRQLEERLACFLGTKHAVAVCNATLGLQIAAKALRLTGEVIMPSFTFVATAHALEWIGLKPVFADIDPATHNIDPRRIAEAITDRTSAIVGVHLWGTPCDVTRIEAVAKDRGLSVMYDASHAFASSLGGRKLGGFGSCEVFSLHATKFVHTFEGGVVTTNDDALAEKMRLMRNFGFQDYDKVVSSGINAKMTEIAAAMGLCCLDQIDEFTNVNRRNYLSYAECLNGVPGISVVSYKEPDQGNYQYVVIEVDEDVCSRSRDEIVDALHAEKVIARRYFWPGCHRMEPYRTLQPDAWTRLPETERIASRVIVLPSGQAVDNETVRCVCGIIREAATP
jgi:dTDP-4-amino-4,6-dideoxygalactose transaminase